MCRVWDMRTKVLLFSGIMHSESTRACSVCHAELLQTCLAGSPGFQRINLVTVGLKYPLFCARCKYIALLGMMTQWLPS